MIQKYLLSFAIAATLLMGAQMASAQTAGMSVNTTGSAANSSSMLDVSSTSSPFKGMLIPRVSNTNMNSITVNASTNGLMVYNTTLDAFYFYNQSTTSWVPIGDGAGTGAAGGDLTGNYPNPTISSSAGTGNNIVTAINASTGGLDGTKLATNSVSVNALSATGTPSSTTFLRGDNTWATVSGGSGTVTSVSSGSLTPIFQTTVSNATTTPTINYSLNNAPIFSVLTNSTGAISTPVYGKVVPSALAFPNGGTAGSTTFYRGDGAWATPGAFTTNGDIEYYNSGSIQRLPIGSSTQVLTVSSGLPAWAPPAAGNIAWTTQTANFNAAVGGHYLLTSGSATITLPTVHAVGDMIQVASRLITWHLNTNGATCTDAIGNTYSGSSLLMDNATGYFSNFTLVWDGTDWVGTSTN